MTKALLRIRALDFAGCSRLCLKTPSSARERAVFRLAKPVPSNAKGTEAGDIGFIVDAAGCSQAENKPLEARSNFQTEPN